MIKFSQFTIKNIMDITKTTFMMKWKWQNLSQSLDTKKTETRQNQW